uniref:BRCA1-associated ATM activator 1 n=1 Tax=Erpetoichthys calabaricus TaxID=27687 RepID=A0A8C4SZ42_ERPCA
METECIMLLPSVCAVLANPELPIPDDTCLEKLLDWFKVMTCKAPVESLMQQNTCLTELIATVIKQKDPEPCMLSFIFRLTGLLAASVDGFSFLEHLRLLGEVFGNRELMQKRTWEDATVRCGWIHGLLNAVQNLKAFQFILKNELIEVILPLQQDCSLFVSSAASQLLIQLLTLPAQQSMNAPVLRGDGHSSDMKDLLQSTSNENHEWTDVVKHIGMHVEETLLSGEPFHIEQSLKLMTLACKRCEPWILQILWEKVVGHIESLLETHPTTLTQPLVELLLSVSRTPIYQEADSTISTLLMHFLQTISPAQAGSLASGILNLKNCPQSLGMSAISVILHPLEFILYSASQQPQDPGLLETRFYEDMTIEEQLCRKTSCIALLGNSLSHIHELLEIITQPYYATHFRPEAILSSVLLVLQMCIGAAIPTTPAGSQICRHLIGSVKVQKFAVDALGSILHLKGIVVSDSVHHLLLEYLRNPDTDSLVLKKVMQATLKYVLCFSDLTAMWPIFDKDLFPVLKKRLCDIRWEVRDSTLELLTHLTLHLQDNEEFPPLLLNSGILQIAMSLLKDHEGYVRASTVSFLGQAIYIMNNKDDKLNSNTIQFTQEGIVSQLVDILSQDSESFPRRAALRVFTGWLQQCSRLPIENFEESLSVVFKVGCSDFDWEVRVHSLELAEVWIDQTLANTLVPSCPYAVTPSTDLKRKSLSELMLKLKTLQIFDILFVGLHDCDRPVAQKACAVLMSLQKIIFEKGDFPTNEVSTNGHEKAGSILKDCFLTQNSAAQTGLINLTGKTVDNIAEILAALDLKTIQNNLGHSSDYIQNSPRSLLQDILAVAETTVDNVIDCY